MQPLTIPLTSILISTAINECAWTLIYIQLYSSAWEDQKQKKQLMK